MNRREISNLEGFLVAVPVQDAAWGFGVICRASRSGILLMRFYKLRLSDLADAREQPECLFEPSNTAAIAHVGSLGLHENRWKVIKRIESWQSEKWGQTEFSRVEERDVPIYFIEKYADDDPNLNTGRRAVTLEEAKRFPSDGLLGSGAAEGMLARLTLNKSTEYEKEFPSHLIQSLAKNVVT